LHASGDESERDVPFALLDQLLRRVAGRLPSALSSITAREGAGVDPVSAGAALTELLGELQADEPLVVFVDDVFWADLPSLQALSFAARRLVADRVLLVLSSRTEELDQVPRALVELAESRGSRIPVRGLTLHDLLALASALRTKLDTEAARELHEHTKGNPLFATALLREGPLERAAPGGPPLPAPSFYADAVVRRFRRCSERTRRLVAAAAVLGLQALLVLAAGVAGLADPASALDEGVDAELVDSRGPPAEAVISFGHPLTRSAVYFGMPAGLRRELHLRAAEQVADRLTSLRHRIMGAGGPDDALAIELDSFARHEALRGSVSSAAWALQAAARLSTRREDRERWALEAVEQAVSAGDSAMVAAEAPGVGEFADTPRARYVNGMLAVVTGRQAEGEALLRSALEALGDPPTDPHLAGSIGGWLAPLWINGGRSSEGVDWARLAIRQGIEEAWPNIALGPGILAAAGHVDEALALTEWAASAPELERTGVDLLTGRGTVELWIEDLEGARRDLHRVMSETKNKGPFVDYLVALFYLADVEFRSGRWDDAITYGALAASTAQDAEQPWIEAFVQSAASWPLSARGDWERAAAHVQAASSAAGVLGDLAARLWTAMSRGRLAHARRDPEGVVAAFEPLLTAEHADGIDNPGIQPWEGLYAEGLVQTGRLDEAEEVLRSLGERPGTARLKSARADVARVRGMLEAARGRTEEAEAAFESSLSLASYIERPFLAARDDLAFGKFLRRRGKRRVAVEHLERARAGFHLLGATPYLEETEQELGASGLAPARRSAAAGHALTPQELAVANLVTRGMSNREVASELVVSVKTVEYHLGHVYAKVGVRSRSELTRRMLEQGATPSD
jgi:DNA-binding CsgD family transcriptional regulator